MIRKK